MPPWWTCWYCLVLNSRPAQLTAALQGVMMSKPNMWSLDCAVAVLPAFENLINSKHESYVPPAWTLICSGALTMPMCAVMSLQHAIPQRLCIRPLGS